MSECGLTEQQAREVIAALHARRAETEHYLRSYASTGPPCCDVERARQLERERGREALQKRLAVIDDALAILDATCVDRAAEASK